MIYLDYAASTPIEKEVLDVFYDVSSQCYANPNSNHELGREAKKLLDNSTLSIANCLHILPDEIIYTSGASESNNLVVKGITSRYKARGKHIIVSSLEHNSILVPLTKLQEQGFEVEIINVLKDGRVDIDTLKKMIRDDTILVSICSVDSELGIRQPIEEIGEILKNYPNTFFHTDASQAFGKILVDFSNVDLVTIAPHKFYGMNGFGMLIKKKNVGLVPLIDGGKSTTVFRSGTPVVASVVALEKAVEIALLRLDSRFSYVTEVHDIVISRLKKYSSVVINSPKESIPYIINFSVKGVSSLSFVERLSCHGVYVSAKTSCCPIQSPSKLVYAYTRDRTLAATSIRLSLSHLTSKEEIEEFFKIFDLCLKEVDINGKI